MAAPRQHLEISHLLLVTAGIAVAFGVARGIESLRFAADAHFFGLEAPADVDALEMLTAAIYGTCVSLFVVAARGSDFWSSPGKTLALLFATMCVLNWSLDFIAATVTLVRLQEELAPGAVDDRGYVLGFWYRSFAVEVGYVASLPVLVWVLFKTKGQPNSWRLVWAGFLIFALLIVGFVHFGFGEFVGSGLKDIYFEVAIGFPMLLIFAAIVRTLARRQPMDWWTTMTALPILAVWCIALGHKLSA